MSLKLDEEDEEGGGGGGGGVGGEHDEEGGGGVKQFTHKDTTRQICIAISAFCCLCSNSAFG